jgi:tetratricopeptide (TPR) repeat protein
LFVLCLCATQGLTVLSASAQATPEREREAKALFEAGVEAAKAEDYKRAREYFQRSRQLVVKASTLLNLAIADFKLGLVEEALFALDAIEAPSDGPEQERLRARARKVRGEVEALRENIAAQAAQQPPAPAEISAPPTLASEPVDPPSVAATTPSVAPSQASMPAQTEPQTPELPSLAGPRALLALGGGLGAAAIGTALWWRNRYARNDECLHDREDMRCAEHQQIAREKTAAMALTLSLGISAALLVTSGAFWLVRRKSDRRVMTHVSASLWGERSSLGLLAYGRF